MTNDPVTLAPVPVYDGTVQPDPAAQKELRIFPYLPHDDVKEAVRLAIFLRRPLLIKGEPGSGKTRLAHAVRYEFTVRDPGSSLEDPWPLFEWPVKSTSEAREGLYRYKAIEHLRDAQLAALTAQRLRADGADAADEATMDRLIQETEAYIDEGPLGLAFRESRRRPIVLIDEIDKADIDFPNDLLSELEDKRFTIRETGEVVAAAADLDPIIFVTSNDEKDLPDAFLRRCVFHYIDFPDTQRLIEIVNARFENAVDATVVAAAVDRFEKVRQLIIDEKGEAGKRVSTSELLDWVAVLHNESADKDEALARLQGRLPYLGVLLKNWDDHRVYLNRMSQMQSGGGG